MKITTYQMPEPLGGDWAVRIENIPNELMGDNILLGNGIISDGFDTEEDARRWGEQRVEKLRKER